MFTFIIFISFLVVIHGNFLRHGQQKFNLTNTTTSLETSSIHCTYSYQCTDHSSCGYYNGTIGICSCDDGYTTHDGGFCEYKEKSALVALLLTIFLQAIAPVGLLYVDPHLQSWMTIFQLMTCGILAIFIYTAGIFLLSCFVGLICGIDEKHGQVAISFGVILQFIGGIISILTLIWWIYDIVVIANGSLQDGNGVDLNSI